MALFKHEDDYNKEMFRAATEEGVPLAVLKGFFALESQFDAKSYRAEPQINDASYGIAQTLYKTAQGVGYKGTPEGLFDPYTSAKYGARFIAQLHKKYPNDLDVIAAYNAGYPRPITKTTQFIADLFKYPIAYKTNPPAGWVYANQCYVDRVAAYIAYYAAVEKRDLALAEKIKGILAKPSNWPQEFSKYTEARGSLSPIYFMESGEIMNELKKWGLIGFSLLAIWFAVKNIHTTVNGK